MHDTFLFFIMKKMFLIVFFAKITVLRQGFIACTDDFVEIIDGNLEYRFRACGTGRKIKENR